VTLKLHAHLQFSKGLVVAVVLIALAFRLTPTVSAQLAPNYTVGAGNAPPLDGVWHSGQWDDAVELKVAYSNESSLQPAYLRLMHDTLYLYFIYDVPFDTIRAVNATPQLPFMVLVFAGDAKEFSQYDLNDAQLIAEVKSNGETALNIFNGNNPNYQPYLAQAIKDIVIVQAMGSSPHSSKPHRIWEGKIPLQPITMNSPSSSDGLPIIGFNTIVQDALGNAVELQPLSNPYAMTLLKIAPYPVPENLNLITPFLLATVVLSVYAMSRNRKRPKNYGPN